ncbi:DUF3844 domain-containing protein [Favolaschia claudopus]|uniref:DUF3844 domain-containing protein n=1 Tax=Favolaschia claudopus TaxID=2862362 RepID=A0AAW0AB23_9AGAR
MNTLPPYSTSTAAPTYSAAPGGDERMLQRTPFPGQSSRRPTGTFVRHKHGITVALDSQKDDVHLPSYGREGVLSGSLLIDSHESVTAVNMKVEGVIECSLSQGSSRLEAIETGYSLYVKNNAQQLCPAALSFSYRFPSTFNTANISSRRYPLPPSCSIALPGGCYLRCSYSLSFTVISSRHRSASFMTREKSLSIELEYRPRTRPSRPRIADPSLFSTIKLCPEEWLQLPVALTSVSNSNPPDIHCDLFVPSVGVFGISETVPFHLQLSGPAHQLRHLFQHQAATAAATNSLGNSPIIRVSLLRQIVVDAIGQRMNTVLEEPPLRPLPPGIFGLRSSSSDDTLNWEGEIRLHDIPTPSFDIGAFKVMYLLAVELSPPKMSPIKRAYYGYPIRVTTDTWASSAEHGVDQQY